MAFIVYCHVNKINGKRYVGITSQLPAQRWGPNGCKYCNQYFSAAIQKYGWDNFEHNILFTDLTEAEAKALERKLILDWNLTDPTIGYNITLGGEGCCKYETDEQRQEARVESKAKSLAKRNADPERRANYLADLRQRKIMRKNNKEQHEKDLQANRLCHIKQRSTPEGKQKDAAARKQLKQDRKQLRLKLIARYNEHPELFSEEDYHFIFDRRQTPNGSWRYVHESIKQMRLIAEKVLI